MRPIPTLAAVLRKVDNFLLVLVGVGDGRYAATTAILYPIAIFVTVKTNIDAFDPVVTVHISTLLCFLHYTCTVAKC